MDVLKRHHLTLTPALRNTMVQAVLLLRNKNVIPAIQVLPLLFILLRCPDKTLRASLRTHIISDMKSASARHENNKLNKAVQAFMYTMLSDENVIAAKMSLEIMIELYKKNVWYLLQPFS